MTHDLARRLRRLEARSRLGLALAAIHDWTDAIEVAAMMDLSVGGLRADDHADTIEARWAMAAGNLHPIDARHAALALDRLRAWYDDQARLTGWRSRLGEPDS